MPFGSAQPSAIDPPGHRDRHAVICGWAAMAAALSYMRRLDAERGTGGGVALLADDLWSHLADCRPGAEPACRKADPPSNGAVRHGNIQADPPGSDLTNVVQFPTGGAFRRAAVRPRPWRAGPGDGMRASN